MKLIKVQQPDYRNDGRLQFVTGWTGGGAEMCVHLTRKEYADRIEARRGCGTLVEKDGVFYWQPSEENLRKIEIDL